MLIGFFEHLRRYRVPVSVRELIDLLSIFSQRLIFADQDEFYFLSRLSLVKDEKYYDRFDQAFGTYFSGLDDWVGVFKEDESEQLRELLARVMEGNEREVASVMREYGEAVAEAKERARPRGVAADRGVRAHGRERAARRRRERPSLRARARHGRGGG